MDKVHGSVSHLDALASANEPGGHTRGTVAPALQKRPSAHGTHAPRPSSGAYDPAGHSKHDGEASGAKEPGVHSAPDAEPAGHARPRGQKAHPAAPDTLAKLPGAHGLQSLRFPGEKDPGSHGSGGWACEHRCPAGQKRHVQAPSAAYVPSMHDAHSCASPSAKPPGAHSVGWEDVLPQKAPGGHGVHEVASHPA